MPVAVHVGAAFAVTAVDVGGAAAIPGRSSAEGATKGFGEVAKAILGLNGTIVTILKTRITRHSPSWRCRSRSTSCLASSKTSTVNSPSPDLCVVG